MTGNLSATDRGVRLGLAGVLIVTFVVTQAWPILVLALLIGVTGAIGWSPLYSVYGLSTINGLHRECDDDYCGLPASPRRDRGASTRGWLR